MVDRGDGQVDTSQVAALVAEIHRELEQMREDFRGLVTKSSLAWAAGLGVPIVLGFFIGFTYWIVDSQTAAVSARVDDAASALNTRIDDSNATLDTRFAALDTRLDDQSRMIAARVVSDLETSGQLEGAISEALAESALATELNAIGQSLSDVQDQIEQVQQQLSLANPGAPEPDPTFRDEEAEEEGSLGPLRLSNGEDRAPAQADQAAAAQQTEIAEGPTISIEQPASEIIVTLPPAGDGVATGRPQVEVRQFEPTVTVRRAEGQGEPQVEIVQAPPTVTYREQGEGEQAVDAQQIAQGEQQAQQTETAQAQDERSGGEQLAGVEQTGAAEQATERPMIEREGYQMAQASEISVEDLTGSAVYGLNDEDIGEINEIMMSSDGQVENVIIDVGGFLGLGRKPIVVDFDELAVVRAEEGDELRVYLDATADELESMEAYSE